MIQRDRRHHDFEYLWRGAQDGRQFDGWRMGFGTTQPGTLFDWVANTGVHVHDGRSFTAGLLSFMQNVLRAGQDRSAGK